MYKSLKILLCLIIGCILILGSQNIYKPDPGDNTCLECHGDLVNMEFIHVPVNDACENCHEPTGNEHPGVGLPGFKMIAGIPDLCYVCHEALNTMDQVHSPVQEGACLDCHSIHGSPNHYLVKESPVAVLCFQCHDVEIQNHTTLHEPVRQGGCNDCHNPHQSDQSILLKDSIPGLCFSCHEQTGAEYVMSVRHAPFKDDCASCHESHGSDIEHLLVASTPGLCGICHHEIFDQYDKAAIKHRILKDGKNCGNCHVAHASERAALIQKDPLDLCINCHAIEIQTETRIIRNIAGLLQNPRTTHAAIELDGCKTCHQPHGSEYAFLLRNRYPSEIYVTPAIDLFALCFDCHDASIYGEENTTTGTFFRQGTRNLHYVHLTGRKGRSCHICHNAHGTVGAHLVQDRFQYGNWTMKIQYIPTKNGGTCFPGCHEKLEYDRNN